MKFRLPTDGEAANVAYFKHLQEEMANEFASLKQ
jgi:hypothetical protein